MLLGLGGSVQWTSTAVADGSEVEVVCTFAMPLFVEDR